MHDKTWRDEQLDQRERDEVTFSEVYSRFFHHGTVGHNQHMLIAKLAKIIDELRNATETPTTSGDNDVKTAPYDRYYPEIPRLDDHPRK